MTTTMVMKHQDDDGDLSIVTQGDTVLILCSNRHYWIVPSKLQDAPAVDAMAADEVGDAGLGAYARTALGG